MATMQNEYGQLIGEALPSWKKRALPPRIVIEGRFCRVEPLSAKRHAASLHAAYSRAPDGRAWTYMSVGPFADADAYRHWAEAAARSADPLHYAVVDRTTGDALGTLALMRIDAANGVIEVGCVAFSPAMQRTPLSTEAHYLLMKLAFDELGYRRYEWKCDSLNAPSRQAAQRLGFAFEGTFRQAMVYKGRSRDTAWFSIVDGEWPAVRAAFEAWLAPANFDAQGQQRRTLAELRGAAEVMPDE